MSYNAEIQKQSEAHLRRGRMLYNAQRAAKVALFLIGLFLVALALATF